MNTLNRWATLLLILSLSTACVSVDIGSPKASKNDPDAGLLTLASGKTYLVYPDDLNFTGNASFRWPDGREYKGELLAGKPEGTGSERTVAGAAYEGQWHQGVRHGTGVLNGIDNSTYEGEFLNGLREGQGALTSAKGTYVGRWLHDLPHGPGSFNYADGSRYEGLWVVGNRQGYGIFRTAQGGTYEGDWQEDAPNGTGQYNDEKITYNGHWVASKRHGYGELISAAGLSYEGTWNANKRQGFGRETRPDGGVYEGEWQNDKRHGEGVETRADGSYHDGAWEQNRALGPGIRRDSLGFEISGVWNADSVNHGILRLPDGQEYAGSLYLEQNTQIAKNLLQWLHQRHENAFAQYLLGNAYSEFSIPLKNMEAAQSWFDKSARQGYAPAKFKLANIYFAEKIRITRALELLLEAAEADYTDAMVLLGTYYHLGTHLPKNHRIATNYYTRASVKGNLVARNNVAWLLATSSDESVRNGIEAVTLAKPLALMFSSWGYLDTLAAAYAEAGDFAQAIATQKQALAAIAKDANGSEQVVKQMLLQLELFEKGTPYREP